MGERFFFVADALQEEPQIVMCVGEIGIPGERLLITQRRFARSLQIFEQHAEIEIRRRVIRSEFRCSTIVALAFFQHPGIVIELAQI